MNIKVIAALIGVCGIFISAILSSAGYLFKTKLETKRSARKVLYLLLEIRYGIMNSLFDPNEATKAYVARYNYRMKEKGFIVDVSIGYGAMYDLIREHFHNLIISMRTDFKQRLLIPYEEALFEFSTVNPVMAYKLRGKDKFETIITHTNDYKIKHDHLIDVEI